MTGAPALAPAPQVALSRSVQKRQAIQRGEEMPTFAPAPRPPEPTCAKPWCRGITDSHTHGHGSPSQPAPADNDAAVNVIVDKWTDAWNVGDVDSGRAAIDGAVREAMAEGERLEREKHARGTKGAR
jgi:hypothetical protein